MQVAEKPNHLLKRASLTAKRLGALRIIPDVRLRQLPLYLLKAFRLGIEVKDTP